MSFLYPYLNRLGRPIGLNDSEIKQLEIEFDLQLPLAYKHFLRRFGRDSGDLLKGYFVEYLHLKENLSDAMQELSFDDRSEEKITFDKEYLFFAQWQGYNFFFFDCKEKKDDPRVYLYDTSSISKCYDTFTEFIKKEGLAPLLDSFNKFS